MKRRSFITLGAIGGIGAPLFQSESPASEWRPDGVGSVARFGVLTPDFDAVPESEMTAMAPPGVSIHGARVHRQQGGARAFADPPSVDDAVDELVPLRPRAILFAYTSSSYALGAEVEEAVRARLENRSGKIPVLLPALLRRNRFLTEPSAACSRSTAPHHRFRSSIPPAPPVQPL